ncbi:HNH endonuclease [Rosenbergiella nectarea]|uniref:HNH endonuclease n=1 Tax=Rosenbergiella nectarea TaxID=988801 RepID=A0A1H9DG71_9GAMM|nr:HNH endonuclease signature motif containing protein [Rosenbergiella nectarea]SEQ12476.1 HNH endonuclease [Rosenbergiella nectarea]
MNFEEFRIIVNARQAELKAKGLRSNISPAQWEMLKFLFNQGDTFPRNWVPRETLHNLVQQSDYRRRLTELGDEIGLNIERQAGSNAYRLSSLNLKVANPRTYLTKTQKDSLLFNHHYTCQVCSLQDFGNSTGTLQADHKIPLARGGGHNSDNWQTLCHVCNVGKRNACQDCTRDCLQCPWAFPELHGIRVMISLTPADFHKDIALGVNKEYISDWFVNLARSKFDKE